MKNKIVGKAKNITKDLIDVMKDKKRFLNGQARRLKNSKHLEKLKKNMPEKPSCKDILTVLAADQLIYTDDEDIDPDSKKINNFIKNEDKNKFKSKLEWMISSLSQINAPVIDPCPKPPGADDPPVVCLKSESEVYDKPQGYEEKKEISRSYASEVLKAYRASLKEAFDNQGDEDLIAILELKINLIKDFQNKDNGGCYNPYEGFEKDILTDDPDGLPKAKKVPCDYNAGKSWKGLAFGSGCYPQRYSCMTNKEKRNLKKLINKGKFINEDPNKDKSSIKFWLYNKGEAGAKGAYTRNYNYKNGDNYNVEGKYGEKMKVEKADFNLVYEQRGPLSKVKEGMSSNPVYYMETTKNGNKLYENLSIDNLLKGDLQFQNPRYPHFRPTDQCSGPTQGDGGVCFQEACRQHDLCFQTLPNTTGEGMEDRFNRCNRNFKKNIGALCDANAKKGIWGTLKKARCHATKNVFHYAVDELEAKSLFEGHKGFSFNKSQIDAYRYKKKVYNKLAVNYCKNINSEICQEINEKIMSIEDIGSKYNLDQNDPKEVERK